MDVPRLIESKARECIAYSLKRARDMRINMYYYILNFSVAIAFLSIVGIALYLCYRRRPTDDEKRRKLLKDQSMVLSKIRAYQQFSRANEDQITGLSIPSNIDTDGFAL